MATGRTQHASAVLVNACAVLVRGPSGSGKSRLVLELLAEAEAGRLRFARLIGDDRVTVVAAGGRVLVSPVPTLAGLIEVRGLGLLSLPYEPLGKVGLVVDLAAPDAARLPEPSAFTTTLAALEVPRLPVPIGADALPLVLAALHSHAALRHGV